MTASFLIKCVSLAGLAACASAAPSAAAGEWQLNPRLCPDLVEDRIDRRTTLSARDVREDIRDAKRVNCPASAWVYVPSPGYRAAVAPVYTGPTVIYAGRAGYYQYPVVRGRRARRPARINFVFK